MSDYEPVYFSGGPKSGELIAVEPGIPAIRFPRLEAPRLIYRDEDEFGPTFDYMTYNRTDGFLGQNRIYVYAGCHEES